MAKTSLVQMLHVVLQRVEMVAAKQQQAADRAAALALANSHASDADAGPAPGAAEGKEAFPGQEGEEEEGEGGMAAKEAAHRCGSHRRLSIEEVHEVAAEAAKIDAAPIAGEPEPSAPVEGTETSEGNEGVESDEGEGGGQGEGEGGEAIQAAEAEGEKQEKAADALAAAKEQGQTFPSTSHHDAVQLVCELCRLAQKPHKDPKSGKVVYFALHCKLLSMVRPDWRATRRALRAPHSVCASPGTAS